MTSRVLDRLGRRGREERRRGEQERRGGLSRKSGFPLDVDPLRDRSCGTCFLVCNLRERKNERKEERKKRKEKVEKKHRTSVRFSFLYNKRDKKESSDTVR